MPIMKTPPVNETIKEYFRSLVEEMPTRKKEAFKKFMVEEW